MAIILVQNEKTATGDFDHYEDVTGKTYQYPNNRRQHSQPEQPASIR